MKDKSMKALQNYTLIATAFSLLSMMNLQAEEPYTPGRPPEGGFDSFASEFIERHCFDCHGDGTEMGGLSLDDLGPVNETNAGLWESIWAQVAIEEMPPKDEGQPEKLDRLKFTDSILNELGKTMKDKGGFHAHKTTKKANFVSHDLLFGELPKDLKLLPPSSPKRIWRVTPQEHITRLNELINTEPEYDPKHPGLRTHGDAVPLDHGGQLKLYFGVDRINSWQGATVSYAAAVKSAPVVLTAAHKHGFENYAHFSSVNSAESTQILSKAVDILKYMAYGPETLVIDPDQITDDSVLYTAKLEGKNIMGSTASVTYNENIVRPLTPLYHLLRQEKEAYSDAELQKVIEHIFEMVTFRPPEVSETNSYVDLIKELIPKLGQEEGLFRGLSAIFLDRDALFYSELAQTGEPDQSGRVMLQDWELGNALNRALCYIKPDVQLREAIVTGNMRSREDVKRELSRMLADDSIRKPRILQFFREYFDYDLAVYICKDDKALRKTGYGKQRPDRFQGSMLFNLASTDRLVELILEQDQQVLKELLTTQKVIFTGSNKSYYPGIKIRRPKKTPSKDNAKTPGKTTSKERTWKTIRNELESDKTLSMDKRIELLREHHTLKYGHETGYQAPEIPSDSDAFYARVGHRSYGIGSFKPERFLHNAPEGQRLGILTQPSWLVSHSDAMDNHAIHRGIWIRERLLGGGIPDVPITVDAQLPDEPDTPLRDRMRVTREEYCWKCHEKMDPLGLPFEMYDHAGFYRTKELGKPVDTSGEIIDSGSPELDGPVTDALDMITKLANSERVEQVFVRHAFRFWMGRNETIHDRPVLLAAHKAYQESNGSMNALITSLVTSDAFLYRK